jgi:hypothetical protein
MSEEEFDKELNRIITKLEGAGATSIDSSNIEIVDGVTYVKGSDGLYYPR